MVRNYSITDRKLKGVVVIVTGASSGIGREATKSLFAAGAHVILACRNEAKTQEAIDRIKAEVQTPTEGKMEFMKLALDDLSSVKSFADAFLARRLPLHLLINNAGIGASQGGLSKDGYELIFATNHLGHFLLTELLMAKLKETATSLKSNPGSVDVSSVRIINLASRAHMLVAKKQDFILNNLTEKMPGMTKSIGLYGRSKLCNILYTKELTRRFRADGLDDCMKAYSLHPGVVATDIWRVFPWFLQGFMKWFMITEEQGAYTTLYCALSGEVESLSGEYFEDCAIAKNKTALIDDEDLAKQLWDKSEELVKPFRKQ